MSARNSPLVRRMKLNHFSPRRVRGEKYFSGRKRARKARALQRPVNLAENCSFQRNLKKYAPVPLHWDESVVKALRGATQIRGRLPPLASNGAGRVPRAFPPPLRRCPSSGPGRTLSTKGVPLCGLGVRVLLRHRSGYFCDDYMRFCNSCQGIQTMGPEEGFMLLR